MTQSVLDVLAPVDVREYLEETIYIDSIIADLKKKGEYKPAFSRDFTRRDKNGIHKAKRN